MHNKNQLGKSSRHRDMLVSRGDNSIACSSHKNHSSFFISAVCSDVVAPYSQVLCVAATNR